MVETIQQILTAKAMSELDQWIAKYPEDQRQSAVMRALMLVQEERGHLTEASMNAVAEYLRMPAIDVYEVAAFYTMYETKPTGRHHINVCTNISCQLRNSAAIVKHLEEKLSVKLGGTTADERFTLRSVECLGACVHAPMMQVDKDYHENLTPESLDAILEQYS